MKNSKQGAEQVLGYNIPAEVGMPLVEVSTPALIIELDAFERNVVSMKHFVEAAGVRLRAHAKTHKSVDIARYQIDHGGACGMCCQKVSEAETLVAGGIEDILVSNQVTEPVKIDRLADLTGCARIVVCVDDMSNVDVLSHAASRHGTTIECLVEIDCGAGRCGVEWGQPAVDIAKKIAGSPGLVFSGIQAYQGAAQHIRDHSERQARIDFAITQTRGTLDMLSAAGLHCDIIGGGGTGSYPFEAGSGIYNELQCGSYVFMDRDYSQILDANGEPVTDFANSLFVLTGIMSCAKPGHAVCDAGLKAHSVDSGLPSIHGRNDLEYIGATDEHGVISDPGDTLQLNDKLKLIPGHCDPTCNLHDWYVGVRNDRVECLWPVSARGMLL